MDDTTSTTWFITGAGRGFGRAFTTAALGRGDRVAATARDVGHLADLTGRFGDALLPLALDVTDETAAREAVAAAHRHFGRLDVVVNNAGYGHFGAVEELTTDEVQRQLATNFYGPLWISQAAVPLLRQQGSGHLVQISSLGGIGAFANLGAYHASKWALEAFSESLALEVAPFGIRVSIVEPGGYATDWAGSSAARSAALAPYEPMRAAAAARRSGQSAGDPEAAARALLEVVDAGDRAPLRVVFGAQALGIAEQVLTSRLAGWREWAHVSASA
jgi:NAD(P)-dependent dehydrogenase (short-subunit alcohol dehydrogenase family)